MTYLLQCGVCGESGQTSDVPGVCQECRVFVCGANPLTDSQRRAIAEAAVFVETLTRLIAASPVVALPDLPMQ
jgi:hypothetical protein